MRSVSGHQSKEGTASSGAMNHLDLLATAIAGRSVLVRTGIGDAVYTDGQTLYVPPVAETVSHSALMVQAALLGAGSLAPRIVAKLLGQERVAARYITLEMARVAAEFPWILPRHLRERIRAHWSGPIPSGPEESLLRAARDSRLPLADAAQFGTIKPLAVIKGLGSRGATPAGDAERRAAEKKVAPPDSAEEDDDASERSVFLSAMNMPLMSDNPMSRFMKDLFGARHASTPEDEQGNGGEFLANSVKWVKQAGSKARRVASALSLDDFGTPAVTGTL